jgi:uncharacterized membrane protein
MEDPRARRSRLRLGGFLMLMGVLHFVAPKPFMRIVPHVLGRERFWVYASGVAELGSGGLLLSRRTSRIGGVAAAATILAVYPADIQMAIDAGPPRSAMAVGTWLRLPLQFPLIAWALRQTK